MEFNMSLTKTLRKAEHKTKSYSTKYFNFLNNYCRRLPTRGGQGLRKLRVLLEITRFHLHKSVPGVGIVRNAGIIGGRALYEEIRYVRCFSNSKIS